MSNEKSTDLKKFASGLFCKFLHNVSEKAQGRALVWLFYNQTKQFNSQSTRKVQDNLFTLSPSRSSQVNKTFVFPHQQPIILSEESFNLQLIKDNKIVESCLNQTEFIGMSKKKPKSHRKRINAN